MLSNIQMTSFIILTITQVIGFLVLIYIRLNKSNLVGKKGDVGPVGPIGERGKIGDRPRPLPCPTSSPGDIDGDCHILDWQILELKGDKGQKGKKGLSGISNWDSEDTNFHNLICNKNNNFCSNDELISNEVKKMNKRRSREFWNVYIPPSS